MENEVSKNDLIPGYHGDECRYSGGDPNYEIACDECDFYLICFPDWKEIPENRNESPIKKSDAAAVFRHATG